MAWRTISFSSRPPPRSPLTNLHREEILGVADLPKKFTAYTPCFRREAGAAGTRHAWHHSRASIRKVELVKIVEPEKSVRRT